MTTGVWWPRALSAAALTAAVSLCVVSCAGEDRPPGEPAASPATAAVSSGLHPGTFRAELPNGATVKISVPALNVPDPALEQLRQDAGVPRAVYATVDIDNRHGGSPVSASRLILTAQDGATYQLEHVSRALRRWQPRSSGQEQRAPDGSSLSADAARRLRERITRTADGAVKDIPVGKQGRNILVGDISAVPDSFASLELVPLIGDRETAAVRVRSEHGDEDASRDPGPGSVGGRGSGSAGTGGTSTEPDDGIPVGPVPGDDRATAQPSREAPAPPVDPADPVVPDPVAPDPAVPDPVVPGTAVPAPVVPAPAVPDPVVPAPVVPDPVVPAPVVPDPAVPEPGVPDPGAPGPAVTEPPASGSVVPDPLVTGPAPGDRATAARG